MFMSNGTFFYNHKKYHKIEYYFIFELVKKKIWAKFTKNYRTFYYYK